MARLGSLQDPLKERKNEMCFLFSKEEDKRPNAECNLRRTSLSRPGGRGREKKKEVVMGMRVVGGMEKVDGTGGLGGGGAFWTF